MKPEKLNDDQKRFIKTLPGLQAVQKELGEVKGVIEVRIPQVPKCTHFHLLPAIHHPWSFFVQLNN